MGGSPPRVHAAPSLRSPPRTSPAVKEPGTDRLDIDLLVLVGWRPRHDLILIAPVEWTPVVWAHPGPRVEVQVAPAALGSLIEPLLVGIIEIVKHHDQPLGLKTQDALGAWLGL